MRDPQRFAPDGFDYEGEAVVATLRRAAANTDLGALPDLGAAVAGGQRRVARRRRATFAVAASAAVLVTAAAVAAPQLSGSNTLPADDHKRPHPSPSIDEHDAQLADELGNRAAFQHLLAQPNVSLGTVQYTSPTDAAVTLRGCSEGGCRVAVLTTRDNWASETGAVLPGLTDEVWVQALPGGSVAVAASDITIPDGFDGRPVAPFLLRADGTVSRLILSTEPLEPDPDAVLVSAPPLRKAMDAGAAVWAVNASAGSMYPTASQPCACTGQQVSPPVTDTDGTAHVTIWNPTKTPGGEWGFAQSRDNGETWQTSRTNVLRGLEDTPLPGYFAAGPDRRLAASLSVDGATLAPLRELYVSDDEHEWRQIALTDAPTTTAGMAFTPDGALLLADDTDKRLWRLASDGTTLEPVDGPRVESLEATGGMLIARTGSRMLAVSSNGVDWPTVTPGQTLGAGG